MSQKACPSCLGLMGDCTRVRIIKRLKEKPQNVSKIAECFCLTQPTITHHLRALEKMGMVSAERKGRKTYYSLNVNYPCKNCGIFDLPFKLNAKNP